MQMKHGRIDPKRRELPQLPQKTFDCGICFETHPEDAATKIDRCNHQYCSECVKAYIVSRLEERRYPIICPVCSARNGRAPAGVIGEEIVRRAGLTPALYQRWSELGVGDVSVTTQCPKCKESLVVDREDYHDEDNNMISCPLRGCDGYWCKKCSKICRPNKKHTCGGSIFLRFWKKPNRDSSSEMDKLIKKKRWMRCPGCKTPMEKTEGCNHMTCIVPGCRNHFCYRCGKPTDDGGGHSCSNRFGWRR